MGSRGIFNDPAAGRFLVNVVESSENRKTPLMEFSHDLGLICRDGLSASACRYGSGEHRQWLALAADVIPDDSAPLGFLLLGVKLTNNRLESAVREFGNARSGVCPVAAGGGVYGDAHVI